MADVLVNLNSSAAATSSGLYSDVRGLDRLKLQSRTDPQGAIGEVARQFESVFVTMMMKAMRDTLPQDGLLSSSQMGTYQEMFDQQLAMDLSEQGGLGLASLIEKQLSASQRYRSDEASAFNVTPGASPASAASYSVVPAAFETPVPAKAATGTSNAEDTAGIPPIRDSRFRGNDEVAGSAAGPGR